MAESVKSLFPVLEGEDISTRGWKDWQRAFLTDLHHRRPPITELLVFAQLCYWWEIVYRQYAHGQRQLPLDHSGKPIPLDTAPLTCYVSAIRIAEWFCGQISLEQVKGALAELEALEVFTTEKRPGFALPVGRTCNVEKIKDWRKKYRKGSLKDTVCDEDGTLLVRLPGRSWGVFGPGGGFQAVLRESDTTKGEIHPIAGGNSPYREGEIHPNTIIRERKERDTGKESATKGRTEPSAGAPARVNGEISETGRSRPTSPQTFRELFDYPNLWEIPEIERSTAPQREVVARLLTTVVGQGWVTLELPTAPSWKMSRTFQQTVRLLLSIVGKAWHLPVATPVWVPDDPEDFFRIAVSAIKQFAHSRAAGGNGPAPLLPWIYKEAVDPTMSRSGLFLAARGLKAAISASSPSRYRSEVEKRLGAVPTAKIAKALKEPGAQIPDLVDSLTWGTLLQWGAYVRERADGIVSLSKAHQATTGVAGFGLTAELPCDEFGIFHLWRSFCYYTDAGMNYFLPKIGTERWREFVSWAKHGPDDCYACLDATEMISDGEIEKEKEKTIYSNAMGCLERHPELVAPDLSDELGISPLPSEVQFHASILYRLTKLAVAENGKYGTTAWNALLTMKIHLESHVQNLTVGHSQLLVYAENRFSFIASVWAEDHPKLLKQAQEAGILPVDGLY